MHIMVACILVLVAGAVLGWHTLGIGLLVVVVAYVALIAGIIILEVVGRLYHRYFTARGRSAKN
jgi:hypothetical protein